MDYGSMKAGELRSLAKERGIKVPPKAAKAAVVALLEAADTPIDVAATVVENEMMPSKPFEIDMAVVHADIDELTEAIDHALTVYGDVEADEATIEGMRAEDIAICEKQLADAAGAANEARLKLSRDYRAPLDTANVKYKELMGPVEELERMYRQRREDLRYMGLRRTYEDACATNGFESLPQVVPFDRLLKANPRWMQRNANAFKAAEKVEEEAIRIIRDWRTLKGQQASMRFFGEAEAEFFKCLDVLKAIEFNNRREDEQRRIDALEAERRENEAARAAYVQQVPQQPAPVQAAVPELARVPERPMVETRDRYRFEADFTAAEVDSLREWKNALNVGRNWTFKQVKKG